MDLYRLISLAAVLAVAGVSAPVVAPALLKSIVVSSDANSPPPARVEAAPAASPQAPPRAAPSTQPREPVSSGRKVALRSDDYGQFQADAVINGHAVTVIVDTGATTVAISTDTARQLGVAPPQSAYRLPISTANGVGYAAPVVLREVRVGSISIRDVNAVVIPGKGLGVSLLGMTFLSRLSKFEVARGQLVLTE